ncbi:MAG: hypothetical protein ACK5NB_07360 [Flavobacteriaceae bacterium]
MKKKLIFFVLLLSVFSCSYFDEHYKAKEIIRDYLKKSLHNPKSLEEINWTFHQRFATKCENDTLNGLEAEYDDCIQKTDFKKTTESEDELGGKIMFVKLEYRAENGYGALRKNELYASYIEKDTISFMDINDIVYSKKLGKIKDVGKAFFVTPKFQYLRNEFFLGDNKTMNDFYNEYPEYKTK